MCWVHAIEWVFGAGSLRLVEVKQCTQRRFAQGLGPNSRTGPAFGWQRLATDQGAWAYVGVPTTGFLVRCFWALVRGLLGAGIVTSLLSCKQCRSVLPASCLQSFHKLDEVGCAKTVVPQHIPVFVG